MSIQRGVRIRIAAALLTAATLPFVAAGPAAAAPPRDQQWYLDRIGVPEAQTVARGDGVLVGMFLASVDTSRPELAGRIRPNKYVRANGTVDDRPESAVSTAGRERDTGLAGLVAAAGGDGPLGVAPRAEIQPINGPIGEGSVSVALRWLVDQGAKVIDMSGGFTVDDNVRAIDGIRYAVANDVVVIMDAEHADRLAEPATTGVLVVGGVNEAGERNGRTSFGSRIDLAAPGATLGLVGLTDPGANGGYGPITAAGDQQASAIVAGVAALIRSRSPELNAASVVDRLLHTARDAGPAGPDSSFGAGIVDAGAAVTSDRPAVTENPLGDPGPPEGESLLDRIGGTLTVVVASLCCLLVVVVVVGLLILLRVRRRRR
ncbi:S8 family serine peptidase [Plantactinospora sp. B5E13]|uniref:S8 family peptidase n=1 Tax=unclassified Plantactinospora TaxID=2631981 RepID=UPI00325C58EF